MENIVSEMIKADSHIHEFGTRENAQNQDIKENKPLIRKREETAPMKSGPTEGVPYQDIIETSDLGQKFASNNLLREISVGKERDSQLTSINRATNNKDNAVGGNSDSKPKWADLGKKHNTTDSDDSKERSRTETDVSKKTDSNGKTVKRKISDKSMGDDMPSGVVELENTKDLPKKESDLRLLSLDERMDILIAGERARERLEDADYSSHPNVIGYKLTDSAGKYDSALSPTGNNSVCTSTTFTSITSDSSDFSPEPPVDFSSRKKKSGKFSFTSSSTDGATHTNNLVPVTMMDSTDSVTSIDLLTLTSDSTSYWWDVEEEEDNHVKYSTVHQNSPAHHGLGEQVDSDDLRNIEEGNVSNDELRRRRVLQHIRALQRTR